MGQMSMEFCTLHLMILGWLVTLIVMGHRGVTRKPILYHVRSYWGKKNQKIKKHYIAFITRGEGFFYLLYKIFIFWGIFFKFLWPSGVRKVVERREGKDREGENAIFGLKMRFLVRLVHLEQSKVLVRLVHLEHNSPSLLVWGAVHLLIGIYTFISIRLEIYKLLGDCVIDAFHYHTKDGVPVSCRGWSRMHALIDSFIQGSVPHQLLKSIALPQSIAYCFCLFGLWRCIWSRARWEDRARRSTRE